MSYVIGLVDESIDRLPDGHISGLYEHCGTDSFRAALIEATVLMKNSPDRETIICREADLLNRDDENPELTVLWSSKDDDRLKNGYLEYTSDEWKGETSGKLLCKESRSPSVYIDIDGTLGKWYEKREGFTSMEDILNPSNHYFRDIEPHPFMIEVARALQDKGYDVCIISAAERDTIRDKMEWLDNNMPFIPKENIFFSPLGADKTNFVKENAEISVLIDDYPANLKKWPGKAIKAINTVNSHQNKYPEIDIAFPENRTQKHETLMAELEQRVFAGEIPEQELEQEKSIYVRAMAHDMTRACDTVENEIEKIKTEHNIIFDAHDKKSKQEERES